MILAREVYLQLVKHRPDNVDSTKTHTTVKYSCPVNACPMDRREHVPWPDAFSPSPGPLRASDGPRPS